ncbi:hypothetical protein BH11CYA1_BH11CYA1_32220 [soil metagenome]
MRNLKPTPRILLNLALAISATLLCNQDAGARNLFVSPSGTGESGSSWESAWTEPAKINWKKVASGDQIYIDGGTSGITYNSSMTIPVGNVAIRQSVEPGHDGQIILSGAGTGLRQNPPIGIKFAASNIQIVAAKRSGIKLQSYATEAINIQTNGNYLANVEVNLLTGLPPMGQGRVAGLTFGGNNNQFLNCDFRDTLYGAVEKPVAGVTNVAGFRDCTFGSNYYGYYGQDGTGLVCSRTPLDVASPSIYLQGCVFGPFVNYGVDVADSNIVISKCLFLSARTANLNFTPSAAGSGVVQLANCTVYQKPIIPGTRINAPMPQNAITCNGLGSLNVTNSVVYGGMVNVPPAQVINGGGNIQYAVSGNTVAIAPRLVDPNFVDSATLSAAVAPTAFFPRILTTLNFSLAETKSRVAKGSLIVRVSDICPPYGPNSGIPTVFGGP